ncbi:hypothetical protein JZ751_004197 [Albula glossodonta]|uniref:Uncharacterized protein n=1 Tax=Albula glossodonta TaxID=121402 RepID=A0A8T2MMA5_9TELE|nr:hypothetical protein JZ751_004197 [Albula glossodonta]
MPFPTSACEGSGGPHLLFQDEAKCSPKLNTFSETYSAALWTKADAALTTHLEYTDPHTCRTPTRTPGVHRPAHLEYTDPHTCHTPTRTPGVH